MTHCRPTHHSSQVVALVGLVAVIVGCGGSKAKPGDADQAPPKEVRVITAMPVALPEVVAVSGTLGAEEIVELGMKVAGRLNELTVDLGSPVEKGQVLARLAPTDFALRVAQAEAGQAQARARLGLGDSTGSDGDVIDPETTAVVRQAAAVVAEASAARDRARALFAEKLLPRADLDTAEANWQVAEGRLQDAREEVLNRQGVLAQRRSELELAREQLNATVLVAPFSGAIQERHASAGQYLAVGAPVFTVVRIHPLRLRLAVPERDAARVRVGQRVDVRVDGDPQRHAGTVARVSPALDDRDRTLAVEAEVPNPDGALRAGSFAAAEIVTAADQTAIVVPQSAIVTFAGIEKVIVVVDGKAVERRVRTGRRLAAEGGGGVARVEIVSGLEGGEQVVVEPGNLVTGQGVAVTAAGDGAQS